MASLYKRKGSSYWWIKFTDAAGQVQQQSTGYRYGIGQETRDARQLAADRSAAEFRARGPHSAQQWDRWVDPFLKLKYKFRQRTMSRYLVAWRTLRMFLQEHKIFLPRQLTRTHCFNYLPWREEPDRRAGKFRAGHNTALLELKVLGRVMREAVFRGFAPANPCRELEISRAPRKLKPEFSDADYALLTAAASAKAEPNRSRLLHSLAIARYHGARLGETNVHPRTDVRFWLEPLPADHHGPPCQRGSIRFLQKGGKERIKPLHPKLFALFQQLQAAHAAHTYAPWPKQWGNIWTKLIDECGLKAQKPGACFHCTRVTVESRLLRAGIKKEIRMEYLSHDAKDVNAMYDRFTLEDMRVCHSVEL